MKIFNNCYHRQARVTCTGRPKSSWQWWCGDLKGTHGDLCGVAKGSFKWMQARAGSFIAGDTLLLLLLIITHFWWMEA